MFLGLQALRSLLEEARQLAERLPLHESNRLHNLINNIDSLANQLTDLERRGFSNTPEAYAIRRQLRDQLSELSDFMKKV